MHLHKVMTKVTFTYGGCVKLDCYILFIHFVLSVLQSSHFMLFSQRVCLRVTYGINAKLCGLASLDILFFLYNTKSVAELCFQESHFFIQK